MSARPVEVEWSYECTMQRDGSWLAVAEFPGTGGFFGHPTPRYSVRGNDSQQTVALLTAWLRMVMSNRVGEA